MSETYKQERAYKYESGMLTETITTRAEINIPDQDGTQGRNKSVTINEYNASGTVNFIELIKKEHKQAKEKLVSIEANEKWLKDVHTSGGLNIRMEAVLKARKNDSKREYKHLDTWMGVYMKKLSTQREKEQTLNSLKLIESAMEEMKKVGVKL